MQAQETPQNGSWIVIDFKFHTGEVLPELRLYYTTLGDPKNEAVLILHGTTGSGDGMLGTTTWSWRNTAWSLTRQVLVHWLQVTRGLSLQGGQKSVQRHKAALWGQAQNGLNRRHRHCHLADPAARVHGYTFENENKQTPAF